MSLIQYIYIYIYIYVTHSQHGQLCDRCNKFRPHNNCLLIRQKGCWEENEVIAFFLIMSQDSSYWRFSAISNSSDSADFLIIRTPGSLFIF